LAAYKSRRWADCGCGEVYYGPWIDTPPECCDACDNYGNFHARRYWTSANSWRSNTRQSFNPWQAGNPHPGGPYQNNMGPMDGNMPTGGPVMDDSMDGMPMQGETIGPGNQMPTPVDPQMNPNPAINQPTPAGPPPSPSPRMGRRPRGMAMRPASPYDNNFVAPAAGYNFNYND
jgi:hypothetical protein